MVLAPHSSVYATPLSWLITQCLSVDLSDHQFFCASCFGQLILSQLRTQLLFVVQYYIYTRDDRN